MYLYSRSSSSTATDSGSSRQSYFYAPGGTFSDDNGVKTAAVAGRKRGDHGLLGSGSTEATETEAVGTPFSLLQRCLAEVIGTFILTAGIILVVAAAVTTGAQVGLWQVAIVVCLSVVTGILVAGPVSGAHLNPAVTLTTAIFRPEAIRWRDVIPYMGAQLLGGMLAGLMVLALYGGFIDRLEASLNVTRGEEGSQITAMCFGEYFPNPAIFMDGSGDEAFSMGQAFFAEAFGTLIIMLVILSLTDVRSSNPLTGKPSILTPLLIGLTVGFMVSLLAPLTQAGFNPARDFGPRIVAAIAGWGTMAIPGRRSGFWVYIVAPFVGAIAAAVIFDYVLHYDRPLAKRNKQG